MRYIQQCSFQSINQSFSNINKNKIFIVCCKNEKEKIFMFRFSADIVNIMNSNFIEIVLTLLDKVKKEYSDSKKLSDNTMSMLSFLFGTMATQAFELIDRQCITLIQTPSGRELYQIQRGTNDFHICLRNSNYCSCPAFFFHVLKGNQCMCKHKLATLLCSSMGLCKELQYSDETVSLMLAGES